jgi:hypothetical protein
VKGAAMMFGDNESVVNTASIPHGKLHKQHNALAFHRTREAITTNITRYHHINKKKNPSDILSKQWDMPSVWDSKLSNPYSFGSGLMQTDPQGTDPRRILLPQSPQRQDPNNHGLIKGSDKMCNFIHTSMESLKCQAARILKKCTGHKDNKELIAMLASAPNDRGVYDVAQFQNMNVDPLVGSAFNTIMLMQSKT